MPVRAALNYKGLPYETKWIEYPDIAPTLKSFDIPPNEGENATAYTVPAVRLPNGKYVMDTKHILPELEKLQPEPSLHLDSEYVPRLLVILRGVWGSLIKLILPQTAVALNPPSRDFFEPSRGEHLGVPLETLRNDTKVAEQAWEDVRPHIKALVELLKENDGDFVGGKELGYPDLYLIGMWQHIKKVSREDMYKKLMEEKAIEKHNKACEKWTERNDH